MIATTTAGRHKEYRPDIDGLRAVAVLAVVSFHAFPDWIKGGFTGVDIFFVISGFLISRIIMRGLVCANFRIIDFYARRVRRIFPALILISIASYVLGWYVMVADEYEQLGKYILGGAGFFSNFLAWNEQGYFDKSAEVKPLLHLWSLAIEEQFYVVWPLLLWLASGRLRVLAAMVVVIALSFYLNINGVRDDLVATFYSPLTRFWELALGGVAAWWSLQKEIEPLDHSKRQDCAFSVKSNWLVWLMGNTKLHDIQSAAGLLLVVYGIFGISKSASFPGFWALIPTLGAALLILAGEKAWVNRTILANRALVWIGLISYPLYLWHWPLLSFARIMEGTVPSANVRVFAVFASIGLAWLTFKLVETPIRRANHAAVKTASLTGLMVAIASAGCLTYASDGLPERFAHTSLEKYAASIVTPVRQAECFDIPYAYKVSENWFCELGSRKSVASYFVHGDSHALSLIPAFEKYGKATGGKFLFAGASGCPSLLGIQSMRGSAAIEKFNCQELNERVFRHVEKSGIKNVILINRWNYYVGDPAFPGELNLIARDVNGVIDRNTSAADFVWGLENTVQKYRKIGVRVFLIRDNPRQTSAPRDILRKGYSSDYEFNQFSVSYIGHKTAQQFVNDVIARQQAKIIDFDLLLCNNENCPIVKDGKFLYSDNDHLSLTGAMLAYPALARALKE